MKTKWRLLQFALAACILVVVAYVAYSFHHSFGFVLDTFGLMFAVGSLRSGLFTDKKVSLRVKLAVFSLGVALLIVGMYLDLHSF